MVIPTLERKPAAECPVAIIFNARHVLNLGGEARLVQDPKGDFHLLEPHSKPVTAPNLQSDYETTS